MFHAPHREQERRKAAMPKLKRGPVPRSYRAAMPECDLESPAGAAAAAGGASLARIPARFPHPPPSHTPNRICLAQPSSNVSCSACSSGRPDGYLSLHEAKYFML